MCVGEGNRISFPNNYTCGILFLFCHSSSMTHVMYVHVVCLTLPNSLLLVSRKDFDVMDGAEEATSSVFMLLANACLNLMVLSTKVRKSDSKVSTSSIPHMVYHRMLWSKSTVPVCVHVHIHKVIVYITWCVSSCGRKERKGGRVYLVCIVCWRIK